MEKYVLKKEDYEDISFLINISKSLGGIYIELTKIENKFGKNSKEYQEHLNSLKSLINVENNIYNGMKKEFNKCLAFIEYLENLMGNKIDVDNYAIIFDDIYSNEFLRIIIRLKKYVLETEEKFETLNGFPDENIKQPITKAFAYSSKIFSVVQMDSLRCFLAILNKDNLNELCIDMKYKISYLFPEIEDEFLDNNFDINNNPYISAQLFTDLLSRDKTLLDNIRLAEFRDNLNEKIDIFCKYDNFKLKNNNTKKNLIMRMYFLRALIIFVDSDIIDKMSINFQKDIIAEGNRPYLTNIVDSLKILGECFNHQNEDIEIPKVLTLNKF